MVAAVALRRSRLVLPRWASWALLAGAMMLFVGDAALQAHRSNLNASCFPLFAATAGVVRNR